MADEPDLHVGDSGEWVTFLQQRLQGISLYDGPVDGTYTEETDAAVGLLHDAAGMPHEGAVSAQTWQALLEQEQRAGIGQGGEAAADSTVEEIPVGQLSEDGQWRWDGTGWQAAAEEQAAEAPAAEGQLSEDGQWRWDGSAWQPVTPDQSAEKQTGAAHEIAVNEDADDPSTEEAALIG
jgi:peptidoglycan hydrolase-like protein with peptidoglycan-binding domain